MGSADGELDPSGATALVEKNIANPNAGIANNGVDLKVEVSLKYALNFPDKVRVGDTPFLAAALKPMRRSLKGFNRRDEDEVESMNVSPHQPSLVVATKVSSHEKKNTICAASKHHAAHQSCP
jgi:hypothetical protein